MANIGMTKANVYADLALSRFSKSVNKSTQIISANQTNSTNGNQSSRVGMTDTLRLDIAGKSAAIKSMAVSQSYLATTISVLDSASDMLARMYELAVLAANSSNTAADNVAIDIETERLSDRFHAIMSSTQFKGKEIFQEIPNSLVMAADGNGSSTASDASMTNYATYDLDIGELANGSGCWDSPATTTSGYGTTKAYLTNNNLITASNNSECNSATRFVGSIQLENTVTVTSTTKTYGLTWDIRNLGLWIVHGGGIHPGGFGMGPFLPVFSFE